MTPFPSYWFGWLSGAATVWRTMAEEVRDESYGRWGSGIDDVAEMLEERAKLLMVEPAPVIKVV